mmetsp:Transcript_22157/g.50723  ORF Transcript_22157/g.50723 Transcript_22157/m.50723 type:complete len:86 (+) Transcript_22157:1207-1464(+)
MLYIILTGERPFKLNEIKNSDNTILRKLILDGVLPTVPEKFQKSSDKAIKALLEAMEMTFTFDPEKRPSARHISDFLSGKLKELR